MTIFDAHADIWHNVAEKSKAGERDIFVKHHLEKFNKGGITSAIFAVYVNHNENRLIHQTKLLEQLKYLAIELHRNKDVLKLVLNYNDLEIARIENKIGVIIGLEGLTYIEKDPEYLYLLHQLGARHAMLTHNDDNELGIGAKSRSAMGITENGKKAIKIMEELNMIVDISHCNERTFWDVMDIATTPVIASHNNARALSATHKNLSDEQLMAIKESGGVVGINVLNNHISLEKDMQNINRVADHIDYIVDKVGIDAMGFGFDFMDYFVRGKEKELKGFENVGKTQDLIEILKNRGYKLEDIEKIKYKNFYRVINQVLG